MIGRFAVVVLALILVLSAAGYGIVRGFTGAGNSEFDECIRAWQRAIGRPADMQTTSPALLCEQYR